MLYTRDAPLTPPDPERIASDASAALQPAADPRHRPRDHAGAARVRRAAAARRRRSRAPSRRTSEDQTTQLVTVWTKDDATETVVKDVATLRAIVPDPDADGLRAFVTGEAGFAADQAAALEGIDETLLAVTLALVIVLLGVIYRSPIVALVPVFVVGLAYLVAAALVYAGAKAGLYQATGQATAILIVLMFGAGTDYCLLLLARYREELGKPDAMAIALRRTGARDRLGGRDRGRGHARAGDRRLQRDPLDGPGARDRHGRHRARGRDAAARGARRARDRPEAAQGVDAVAPHRRVRQGPPRGDHRRHARDPDRAARSATSPTAARSTSASSSATRRSPSRASTACRRSSRPARPARSTC